MARTYTLINDPADLPDLFAKCWDSEDLSIDTETTGLDPYDKEFGLLGVVINTDEEGFYLPVGHENFADMEYQPANLPKERVESFLDGLLRGRRAVGKNRPVMHNAAYDQIVLLVTLGLPLDVTDADDTVLVGKLWNENHPSSLKELARTLLGKAEEKAKLTADIDTELETVLIENDEVLHTLKSGKTKIRQIPRPATDWTKKLEAFYLAKADGAGSFKFVTSLTQRVFATFRGRKLVTYRGVMPEDFRYVPVEVAKVYAVDDGYNTIELWKYFKTAFFPQHPELEKLYYDIQQPVDQVMTRATATGIDFDVLELVAAAVKMDERLLELHAEAVRVLDRIIPKDREDLVAEQVLSSHDQLRAVLFDIIGYRPLSTTKKGKASTNKDDLSKLLGTTPKNKALANDGREFLKLRREISELSKIRSTYTESLISRVGEDGKIHPWFNVAGAVSGRMSSNNPNIQNIPRLTPEELAERPWLEGIDVRASFVAPPGKVFVSADYDAMEMVAVAGLSGDENLVKLVNEGKDLHAFTARTTFKVGMELDDKEFKKQYPLHRQKAKTVNFLKVYGGGAFTIANKLGIDIAEATLLDEGYFEAFPGVKTWMDEVYGELDRKKYITYPEFGYVKRMKLPPSELKKSDARAYDRQYKAALRTCQNAVIQGWCAFVVKKAIVDIDRALKEHGLSDDDAQVLVQVHDELIVLAKEEHAPLVARLMQEHMERDFNAVRLRATPQFVRTLSKAAATVVFEREDNDDEQS